VQARVRGGERKKEGRGSRQHEIRRGQDLADGDCYFLLSDAAALRLEE
jgi:hypothetical protein